MRILYFSVIEQHAGWGAEYFLNKAMLRKGISTYPIDYRKNRHRIARILLEFGLPFDAVLVQRGDHFPLEVVTSLCGPRVFLFTELLERCSDADHLFRSDIFDAYLVRGPRCKRILADRGHPAQNKIHYFLSSVDPETFFPQEREKEFDCVFVGSITPRREAILHELSKHFRIEVRRAFGREACDLFNQAKIVLNIHADSFLDTETRVYEVLASGSLLISEALSEENPFRPGVHYVEAASAEDLESAVAYYLNNPAERIGIAQAGYREVIAGHTFDCRAEQLDGLFRALITATRDSSGRIDTKALKVQAFHETLCQVTSAMRWPFDVVQSLLHRMRSTAHRLFS